MKELLQTKLQDIKVQFDQLNEQEAQLNQEKLRLQGAYGALEGLLNEQEAIDAADKAYLMEQVNNDVLKVVKKLERISPRTGKPVRTYIKKAKKGKK